VSSHNRLGAFHGSFFCPFGRHPPQPKGREMKKQHEAREVYRISEAPEHPLAKKYQISERQFRRWVQSGRIAYARPGGLIVLFTSEDIEAAILGSRSDAVQK
jgi:hypothetical protein